MRSCRFRHEGWATKREALGLPHYACPVSTIHHSLYLQLIAQTPFLQWLYSKQWWAGAASQHSAQCGSQTTVGAVGESVPGRIQQKSKLLEDVHGSCKSRGDLKDLGFPRPAVKRVADCGDAPAQQSLSRCPSVPSWPPCSRIGFVGWRPLASTAPGALGCGYWRAVSPLAWLSGTGLGRIEEFRNLAAA